MKFLNVIEYKKYYLSIAAAFVVLSWIFILTFGLKPGIDLSGGAEWQVSLDTTVNKNNIENLFYEKGIRDLSIEEVGEGTFIIRSSEINSSNHNDYLAFLKERFGKVEEYSFSSIGPSVSKELAKKAIWAIVFVLLGISLYITYAFRKVSYPVSSWKYGWVTLLSLFHDVSVTTGFLAVLGKLKNVYIDTNSIVALLVVMGFSVHDTIVVFDRIRENLSFKRGKNFKLSEVINHSVKETFARSVNTSLTLIIVLLAMVLFGPHSLFYFVLTMMVGTFFGTYSSIFIASPLIYLGFKEKD